MRKNKKFLTWAIVMFMIPALACSLLGGNESASSNVSLGADESQDATPTQLPVVEDVEEVAEETPTPSGPVSGPFEGTLGLAQLDSYRANIVLEFTGARGETTESATTDERQEIFLEVTKDPLIWHRTVNIVAEGAIETDSTVDSYYVNDVAYSKVFDNWVAHGGLVGRSQFTDPSAFAPLPETAACDSQPETVNGVSAVRCTFTEQDNISAGLDTSSAQGELWLAEEGNFVVRYNLATENLQLKGAFSGFVEFETYNLSYEIFDVNGDFTIELPAEAQGTEVIDVGGISGDSGIAAPDGAEVFINNDTGGMNYFSRDSLQSIVDFHLQELPAAGWQEVPDESYVDDQNALLVFENEEGFLRVFVQRDLGGEGYFVSITLPFEEIVPGGDTGGTGDTDSGATGGGAATEAPDVPILDDATELFAAGQVVTYYTASEVADILDFYREELTALGWTENAGSAFSDDSTGLLTFEKDGTTLTLAISKESEGRVNVNVIQQ